MKDILLALKSHPQPTPEWAINSAVAVARHLNAKISGAMCIVGIPKVSNFLADRLVGANDAIAEENRRSQDNAQALMRALQEGAGPNLGREAIRIECGHIIESRSLTEHARVFDLAIVPSYGHSETQSVAEALIFSSGRPVLMLPENPEGEAFGSVVIGWDGSRGAARAVHDSMPFLRQAEAVHVVSITSDKELPASPSTQDLVQHLAHHGITASAHAEDAKGQDAGAALVRVTRTLGGELLVMGAYGQSKIREFVLGGATRTILTSAAVPVLLSH